MKKVLFGQGAQEQNSMNKDPFFRTNDILNDVYQKRVRLDGGPESKTDCRSQIWVNFNQKRSQEVEYLVWRDSNDNNVYKLTCGHDFVAAKNKDHKPGKSVPCFECGTDDAYLSLEHEWSHIIFKSNPHLIQKFLDQYQEEMNKKGVTQDIRKFVFGLINALDDLRCTSLWGLVYPGSAERLVDKWRFICEKRKDLNHNITALIFGVGLQADNVLKTGGPLSDLVPHIEKISGMVRGKGCANMLVLIRWFVDECVKTMMNRQQPPPRQLPPPPTNRTPIPTPRGQQGSAAKGDKADRQGKSDARQEKTPDAKLADLLKKQEESRPSKDPAKSVDDAIQNMMKGADSIQKDAQQGHHTPGGCEDDDREASNRQALIHVMNAKADDKDIENSISSGTIDADVAQAVAKLKSAATPKNSHQFLLHSAKARVIIATVRPRDTDPTSVVELTEEELIHVRRMRAAFSQVMGRVRNTSDREGYEVDVQSVIQYLMDPTQDDVFDDEEQQKGFYYKVLFDMSGSMGGQRFEQVARGAEMLKEALDYPFVRGDQWGFRGGSLQRNGVSTPSVWLYKYDQDCQGYLGGSARALGPKGGRQQLPIRCGGLTPMHTALHIAVKHTISHVPAGMMKRVILLTDGDPTQYTTKSKGLSRAFLKGLVHKEVVNARQNGVQVDTIIIGKSIDDDDAIVMFGPRKFWSRTTKDTSIAEALSSLVIKEFTKYLRSS